MIHVYCVQLVTWIRMGIATYLHHLLMLATSAMSIQIVFQVMDLHQHSVYVHGMSKSLAIVISYVEMYSGSKSSLILRYTGMPLKIFATQLQDGPSVVGRV